MSLSIHLNSLNSLSSSLRSHSPLPPSSKAISLNIRPRVIFEHSFPVQSSRYGRRSQRRNHYSRARYTEGKIVYIVGRVDKESEAGGYLADVVILRCLTGQK